MRAVRPERLLRCECGKESTEYCHLAWHVLKPHCNCFRSVLFPEPSGKQVWLVRHGESEFNAARTSYRKELGDPMLFDAPLTELGRSQAREVGLALAYTGVQLAVVSPLRRAIQTCLEALSAGFGARNMKPPPVLVRAEARELLSDSCDMGSPASELRQEFAPGKCPGGLVVEGLDQLEEIWWHCREAQCSPDGQSCKEYWRSTGGWCEPFDACVRRMGDLKRFIIQREETKVVVFGHGDSHNLLCGELLCNCEMAEIAL